MSISQRLTHIQIIRLNHKAICMATKRRCRASLPPIEEDQMSQNWALVAYRTLHHSASSSNLAGKLQQDLGYLKRDLKVVNRQLLRERRTWVGVNHQPVLKGKARAARAIVTKRGASRQKQMRRSRSRFLTSSTSTRSSIWTNSEKSCKGQPAAQLARYVDLTKQVAHLQWLSISSQPPDVKTYPCRLLTCYTRCRPTGQAALLLAAILCNQMDTLHGRSR